MPKKKAQKAAEKALVKAKDAVADAKRSAKKLDKKTRRKAEALRVELKDAKKSVRTSVRRAEGTDAKRAAAADQVAPRRIIVPENSAAENSAAEITAVAVTAVAPDVATTAPVGEPTYRELRERAKLQGIPGYSRMDKATLAAALGRA